METYFKLDGEFLRIVWLNDEDKVPNYTLVGEVLDNFGLSLVNGVRFTFYIVPSISPDIGLCMQLQVHSNDVRGDGGMSSAIIADTGVTNVFGVRYLQEQAVQYLQGEIVDFDTWNS